MDDTYILNCNNHKLGRVWLQQSEELFHIFQRCLVLPIIITPCLKRRYWREVKRTPRDATFGNLGFLCVLINLPPRAPGLCNGSFHSIGLLASRVYRWYVCNFFCLLVYLFEVLEGCPSLSVWLSVRLPVLTYVGQSVSLSVRLSAYPSISLSVYQSIRLFICLYLSMSFSKKIPLFLLYLCQSFSMFICLKVYLNFVQYKLRVFFIFFYL